MTSNLSYCGTVNIIAVKILNTETLGLISQRVCLFHTLTHLLYRLLQSFVKSLSKIKTKKNHSNYTVFVVRALVVVQEKFIYRDNWFNKLACLSVSCTNKNLPKWLIMSTFGNTLNLLTNFSLGWLREKRSSLFLDAQFQL